MIKGEAIAINERHSADTVDTQAAAVDSLILLGGVLRSTRFHSSIGRSVLDLPVTQGMSILQLWADHVAPLARALGNPRLSVRLLLNFAAPRPRSAWEAGSVPLHIEEDPSEFRGTGGILRDLAAGYDDDSHLLVASAAQVLLTPAQNLAAALLRSEADVALVAHHDGTPGSMMLVRCGCMHAIPRLGFVDMKEQALPLIARESSVKVLLQERPTSLPLLTFTAYLDAVRQYHHRQSDSPRQSVFDEDWRPCFAIIEDGAMVQRGARVHNSVVLRGGVVGKDAIVARSVVCPGGIVAAGKIAVDQVIAPAKGQVSR